MIEIFKRVFYVSIAVRGPDSLPGSPGMLAVCLVPWAVASIADSLMQLPERQSLALVGVAIELMLVFTYSWLVLRMAGKLERWPQTLVSLIGVGAVIGALRLPLAYLSAQQVPRGLILQAAEFGFLAWWLVAMANILSRALDRSVGVGVALSAGHFVLYLLLMASLFGILGVAPGAD